MHVLDYLSDPKCERKPKDARSSEYRLLCSGTIYRDILGDPYKSEVARILLDEPLCLFAASRPLTNYPLELVLELTVPQVHEVDQFGTVPGSFIYYPDDEVSKDLAALLTLLCRRLITVGAKAHERHCDYPHPQFGERPCPMPLATAMRHDFWKPHPLAVLHSFEGRTIEDHNPRPKMLNARRLTELLTGLPGIKHAKNTVASCRLYALALELIHERPDISYQLLISSIETLANIALEDFQPDDDVKLTYKKSVYDLAVSESIAEETAKKLAIAACQGEYWATRKFKKFLLDNVAESVWTEPDELFHQVSNEILPKRDRFEKTLGTIYTARSKATHVGAPFPVSASYTGGPKIDVRAASQLYGTDGAFPPVIWFERIVNSSIRSFWERSLMPAGASS